MSIQGISRAAFQQTREFFKHTATSKSANKRYPDDAPVRPDKILRRDTGLLAAGPRIDWANDNARPGRTPYRYGRWLRQQGAQAAGNCGAMSCVAYYYLLVGQAQYAFPFPVRQVEITDLGDHSFLVAGYLPPIVVNVPYERLSTVTIHGMCDAVPDMAESYVVDVWAGIFCPTRVYPFELQLKLHNWSGQGKEVWWGERGWTDPGDEDYAISILYSRFFILDPADPL